VGLSAVGTSGAHAASAACDELPALGLIPFGFDLEASQITRGKLDVAVVGKLPSPELRFHSAFELRAL
jgi:hypothetical protein